MRILLDTHIFLWADNDPEHLSPTAKASIEDTANSLVLSAASIWEIQIKAQLGKLALRLPLAELIDDQQQTNGIEILPKTLAHVLTLDALPQHHRDPFDRLLAAQAKTEGLTLLSADPVFKQYPVSLVG